MRFVQVSSVTPIWQGWTEAWKVLRGCAGVLVIPF